MSNIKIVSDGTSEGTRVLVGDGFINGITKIEIKAIEPGCFVEAVLTIDRVALDIELRNADIETSDPATAEKIRAALLQRLDQE